MNFGQILRETNFRKTLDLTFHPKGNFNMGLLLPAARRPAAAAAGSVAAGPVPTRAHGGSPSASTWTNHTRESIIHVNP